MRSKMLRGLDANEADGHVVSEPSAGGAPGHRRPWRITDMMPLAALRSSNGGCYSTARNAAWGSTSGPRRPVLVMPASGQSQHTQDLAPTRRSRRLVRQEAKRMAGLRFFRFGITRSPVQTSFLVRVVPLEGRVRSASGAPDAATARRGGASRCEEAFPRDGTWSHPSCPHHHRAGRRGGDHGPNQGAGLGTTRRRRTGPPDTRSAP